MLHARVLCGAALLLGLVPFATRGQVPLGTAFTYQGQLKLDGAPLNDRADFKFVMWDAMSGGHQIGSEYQNNGVDVQNGLFTIRVDVGDGVFSGDARWVQVWVRYPTGSGTFIALAPRQFLTPAPYALFSHDTRGVFVADDGKVGLGTGAPKQLLHVEGDYYGRGHLWLHAYEGDGSSGTAYVQARDDSGSSSINLRLRSQSAGSQVEVMTLTPSGFAGIGTTSPQHRLDVNGVGRFSAATGPNLIIRDSNGGADRPGIQFVNNAMHYIAGDDDSNEMCGFYSQFGNQRAYDAVLAVYGNTQGTLGTWDRYLALTHNGTDGRITTDTGHLLLRPAGDVGVATDTPLAPLHVGSAGTKWNWTSGNGWGDFCVSNGSLGLALGVATGGGGTGDVRLWTRGGTERLFIGNPTDNVIMTIDDGRVGIKDTSADARLNVTSLALAAPSQDWAAHFKDANGSGEAWLAGDDGEGRDKGIIAQGSKVGGQFFDTNGTGEARVAYSDADEFHYGIWARGYYGGYFETSEAEGGRAWVGSRFYGVTGHGSWGGGYFVDLNDAGWAEVGSGSSKITGNGGVHFVQNHPVEPDRVVVYTAPEGDEVATYTRGTARLVDGEARVALGETFQWVTNPDIGLTAHLTPRGQAVPLAVVSLSTDEMVVQGPPDGPPDVVFDYLVYGLRIGFEETSTVQEKRREAYIPSMRETRERYAKHPELRQYTAMDRFERMQQDVGTVSSVDRRASAALRDAVHEFDPNVDVFDASSALDGEPRRTEQAGGISARPVAPTSPTVGGEIRTQKDAEVARLEARIARLEAMLGRLGVEDVDPDR